MILYGVLGSVFAGLACACMLVSVTFDVDMRDVCYVAGAVALRETNFQKKKGQLLSVFFSHVGSACWFEVSGFVCF